jgi:hypothetical protein
MNDLENLIPDQLVALASNPACTCREAVIARLRAIAPMVAKRFDAKPVRMRTTIPYERPVPSKPPDTSEAISTLDKFPVDRLMDIVSAATVYARDIRLAAARLVKQRSPLNRYARHQAELASAATVANSPTAQQTAGIAQYAAGAFTNQYDRKIAIRLENDAEFARIMAEAG